MKFTVFGARGFIGSHLTRYLQERGHECQTPARDDGEILNHDLGHTVWAVGITADFRHRPIDTVRAHVAAPIDILQRGGFESFLYLSSTRVYSGAAAAVEDATFSVNPVALNDLYNLSKLMGESLCYASGRPNVRVARLSNVFGSDFESENFLSQVIRDAVEKQEVVFASAAESSKDYVSIDDVVPALLNIALDGRHLVYNVASGTNTTNNQIAGALHSLTGCKIRFAPDAVHIGHALISTERIRREFDFRPQRLMDALPALVRSFSGVNAR